MRLPADAEHAASCGALPKSESDARRRFSFLRLGNGCLLSVEPSVMTLVL